MRRAIALGIAGALVALSGGARANEADAYGLGSRATAMGGAVTADATDFSATYYNPAGLAGATGVSVSIGYMRAYNHLRIDGADNHVADAHGIVGGLVAPGKILGIPFAFGIGTYVPDAGLSRIKALRQETPRWALYDERASILFLSANLAVRPLKWLEIGAGLTFLAATSGRFEISGEADILHVYQSKLRHEVDADLTSIRYPHAGLRVKLEGLGYVGFTYRGETKLKLSLDAHLKGDILFSGLRVPLIYDLESRTIDAFLPQQFVLGLSFQRVRGLHVNADFALVNWAAYESPTAATKAHLAVDLPPGVPITLPADPKPTAVVPPAFKNRLVPRFGVEYIVPVAGAMRRVSGDDREHRLIEIPVRAGYVFEGSPVPPQTGITNFVDADRHTISLGTGLVLNAPGAVLPGSLRLDLHAQISILPERVIHKDNPADFVGDYRADGSMVNIGSTLSAVF